MSDLIAFLAARLNEVEATAKAVQDRSDPWPGQWVADGNHALRTYNGWVLATSIPVGSEFAPGVLEHITLHDPADVLRDVEADRKLLAAYAEVAGMDRDDPEPEYAFGRAAGLGEAVRLRAARFSDHPDFQQEWKL
jgi:hypothetical protein